MKKLGFSYDTSSLTAYVEQNNFPLITKALFTSKTISLMTPMTGVKDKKTLNLMDTNARFQTGGDCVWNASGDTTFTQRTMVVGDIDIMEQLCPKKLEGFYLQTQLPAGSHYTGLPFEEEYTNLKTGIIAEQLEKAVWQGSLTSGDPNLNKFDGALKIIDAASDEIIATPQASISTSTVLGIFRDIDSLIPAALIDKDDLRVFVGWDVFRTLNTKLTTDNLYHYSTDNDYKSGEMYFPGTTMKIVAVHGLNATNRIVAIRLSNFFFGTDLMHEEEKFRIFEFEDGSDAIRFKASFKAGVQVAYTNEIVTYKNT